MNQQATSRARTAVGAKASAAVSPLAILVLLSLALLAVGGAGCKDKGKAAPPPVAGLGAVPVSATVVVSIDVPRVSGSPLVERAVEKLLLQDADLALRWQRLREECKLDVVAKVKHVILALGPRPGAAGAAGAAGATGAAAAPAGGAAPILMVVTGQLAEAELAACVRSLVGKGGGTLSARTAEGRTLYQAKEGNRTVWFGFSRADTVVLGSQEAFVTEALGSGKKVGENPELATYMALADQKESIWAAGQVDPALAERLLRPAAGALKAGPRGFVVSADASSGARVSLGAVMSSVDDAKALELLARQQLALLSMAAQAKGLGRMVGKIASVAEDKTVRISVTLDPSEINQLLSAVDSAGTGSQDAPPAEQSQPVP
jgi:hypothetical protein